MADSMEVNVVWRRPLVLLSVVGVGVASFVTTSQATEASVDVPEELSASGLTPVSIDASSQVDIQNLIGEEGVEEHGISSDSFSDVRQIAETDVGPLYVVPGSAGLCLVIPYAAAACGDPIAEGDPTVALFVPGPSGALIGGGVIRTDTASVSLTQGESTIPATIVEGGFTVSEDLGLSADIFEPIAVAVE